MSIWQVSESSNAAVRPQRPPPTMQILMFLSAMIYIRCHKKVFEVAWI
ncbi:hypothetical protein ASZ90_011217 [hydrocarbon metagenome]|uniref:Uncharacterized protein n=1 Tax=hydrocarbon metagenome TaxID=938273 RepID=A0A0W8FEM4_9ZZZZ